LDSRPILFEHIPKTGGVTLRGILRKVYGGNNMFLINSRDIRSSLDEFKQIPDPKRNQLRVVTGHGASMFEKHLHNPFRVTILREPVSLFISQYHFLKVSRGTVYFDDMQNIHSMEQYIDFALKNGQDNLLTRYLSNSMQWLVDESLPVPEMQNQGEELLSRAIERMHDFDAVINLSDFDAGIFALSRMLGWNHRIPLYKPSNRNTRKDKSFTLTPELLERMSDLLRFDIRLYKHFINNNLDIANHLSKGSLGFKLFAMRQFVAKNIALLLGKN
jgi:hypothetical protein